MRLKKDNFRPLVLIESPYAGDVEANVAYARACVRDAILRGESPMASHLLYAQPGVLRDEVPEERQIGIDAGHAWLHVVDHVAVYVDRGFSSGMKLGIQRANRLDVLVYFRSFGELLENDGRSEDVSVDPACYRIEEA